MRLLDDASVELFFPWNREVGSFRNRIYTYHEFVNYLDDSNGKSDCFSSYYDSSLSVNKLMFDFDAKNPLDKLLVYDQFISYITYELKVRVIPVFTGKKGFHAHVRCEPVETDDRAAVLKAAQIMLLSKAFGIDPEKLLDGEASKIIDTCTIGNLRQLCRIPNTLRPPQNNLYCTFLPEGLEGISLFNLFDHAREPHYYSYSNFKLLNAREFGAPILELVKSKVKKLEEGINTTQLPAGTGLTSKTIVKTLMRPYLWKEITGANPKHHARLAAAIDLLALGYNPSQVIEVFSHFNWIDWDPIETEKQVKSCVDSDGKLIMHPYSRSKLMMHGVG
jgi:hypothetical protein